MRMTGGAITDPRMATCSPPASSASPYRRETATDHEKAFFALAERTRRRAWRIEPEPSVVYYQDRAQLEPWSPEWFRYCGDRYRSFNPDTGTFVGYDGDEHFCVAN